MKCFYESEFFILLDIDECSGDHSCAHTCENKDGSYICVCNVGYQTLDDGSTCQGDTSVYNIWCPTRD